MKIGRFALAVLIVALAAPAALAVDEALDAQLFRPSIFNGHFLAIEDARTLDPLCGGFGLYFNFANSVVQLNNVDQEEFESGVLEQLSTINLTAALGLFRWMSIGVDVPYHVSAHGKNLDDIEDLGVGGAEFDDVSTLGDIKAELKLGLLNEERNKVIGLALAGFGTFPTGDPNYFLGEGTTNFGGKLMLEKDFGFLNIAANGGYLVRPEKTIVNTDVGNAYLFGAGVSKDWKSGIGFSIEYWGSQFVSDSNKQVQANPMEVTGTLRYRFGAGPRVIVGGGGGLAGGVGSPSYRAIAGFDYYPDCAEPTEGKLRVCVTDTESTPLPMSSLSVEAANPFKVDTDADGCYEAVVPPGLYAATASKTGYQSAADSGIVKVGKTTEIVIPLPKVMKTTLAVRVVLENTDNGVPGAIVELKKSDGSKIEITMDKDGNWDGGEWKPGVIGLRTISPGYTDVSTSFTVVEGKANAALLKVKKKIVPIGKIYFAFDSDVILSKSFPVLDNVLVALKAEPDLKKVTIEGHASAEGTDEHNLDLSKRRAESVRKWLIAHGVDAGMLVSVGYGEAKPVAPNDTEEGREQNRRVEFILN